jgi:transcriptional regulator with AAA-type ATPase domain
MRASASPVEVQAGDVVARQGEAECGFHFVEAGALDVVVTSADGLRLPVARLGPGSHFGEMSLLAGIPVSADVVAAETSTLYRISRDEFDALLARAPAITDYLAGELARRLRRTNEQLAAQTQRQARLSTLIGARPTDSFTADLPSFGRSLAAAVAQAAASDSPVLIVGEKGVGKRSLALYIHAASSRAGRSALTLDCRGVAPEEARELLFGDAEPDSVSRFAERLGYLQAADRGVLVLAHCDRLPPEVQADLATFLRAQPAAPDDRRVSVRLIGTAEAAPGSPSAGLCEELARLLPSAHTITLRPLRERRRDIVPLAEHFLYRAARLDGRPPKQLGEDARRKLLSHDYRLENVEELRQVVSLGDNLAEAQVVRAEHLFFGAGIEADTPQVDLLRTTWLRSWLTEGRLLLAAKVAVAFIFAAITAACLLAPNSLPGRVANALAWGLWWPALVLSALFLGRVWCAVCPVGGAGEVSQHGRKGGLSPPQWLKEAWPAPALLGFAAIIWIEYAAEMPAHPRATAFLLLSLAAIAALLGRIFQRHTWCRYLCPLGGMCASFSTVSAIRLRARREVCQASCTGNECYRGSARAKGCPMFSHALFLNGGEHCKLCLECLRACPVQSPRLVLQLPLADIWRSPTIATETASMTVLVGLLTLLLAAAEPPGGGRPFGAWGFAVGVLVAAAVALAARGLLRPPKDDPDENTRVWQGRVICAYAPVVAAALFSVHVLDLPGLQAAVVGVGLMGRGLLQVPAAYLVQGAAFGVGGLMTAWALWRLCRPRFAPPLVRSLAAWLPLAVLACAYLAGTAVLLWRA